MFGKLNKRFLTYFNKNLGSSQRYTAFTLAEVLITLGIIGVVAALTIPTLIQNSQKTALAVAYKKAYNVLSNAYLSIRSDNNGELTSVYTSTDDEINGLCQTLKCAKKCTSGDESCETSSTWKNLHGDNVATPAYYNAILQDGTVLYMGTFSYNCSNNRAADGLCQEIFVDVNGFKKPNQIGRDIFDIMVTKHKVLPNGAIGTVDEIESDDVYCNPNSPGTYNGFTCGNKILKEGAMNY